MIAKLQFYLPTYCRQRWHVRNHQSFFSPTLPHFRRPKAPIQQVRIIHPKHIQNPALNPTMSAAGELLSANLEFWVTESATTPTSANPRAWPNCPTVLKTAPASACVSSGKTSETTRMPTVKSTVTTVIKKM